MGIVTLIFTLIQRQKGFHLELDPGGGHGSGSGMITPCRSEAVTPRAQVVPFLLICQALWDVHSEAQCLEGRGVRVLRYRKVRGGGKRHMSRNFGLPCTGKLVCGSISRTLESQSHIHFLTVLAQFRALAMKPRAIAAKQGLIFCHTGFSIYLSM